MLHFAPEPVVASPLRERFRNYVSADLHDPHVDLSLDITSMKSIPSESIDIVWASHVLEHVRDDRAAIEEIHRVLRPGGWAVLPVPIVADSTVEYEEPCAVEHGHVRASGPDYFDRYRRVFESVDVIESGDVDPQWQTWVYEDRTNPPVHLMPERPAQAGVRHTDYVPICRK